MDWTGELLFLLALVNSVLSLLPTLTHVQSKFEYKYSFKGPYLIDSKGRIPFWTFGGSSIPSEESVRVCPSIKSRKGWVWTKNAFSHPHWMIDVSVRVTGRLKHGADGMAIWFTQNAGTEGQVFGNTEVWRGLGVMLDSFDNDGLHDNPKIQVVLNDGSQVYEHHSDGQRQEKASCLKEFRNRPYPVKLRIIYLRGVLEVWVHEGVSISTDDYELCAKLEKIPELSWIPSSGFFGVTAATGGLSDDHDALSFLTHSMVPLEDRKEEILKMVDQAQMQQMTDQYSERVKEFDQRWEEFDRRYATTGMPAERDWQKEVEMEDSMRLVADMQIALQREIRAVAQKVDILLTSGSLAGGGGGGGTTGGPDKTVAGNLAIEIANIKTTEGNILHQLADLKASVDRSLPVGGAAAASEQLQPVYETKALVAEQSKKMEALMTQLKEVSQGRCPQVAASQSSCVSPWFLVVVIVIQLVVILGYSIYRETRERNAKKFF